MLFFFFQNTKIFLKSWLEILIIIFATDSASSYVWLYCSDVVYPWALQKDIEQLWPSYNKSKEEVLRILRDSSVRFFCLKSFCQKYPIDPLISVLMQFRIQIRIYREIRLLRSFHAMGHCGEFCYALWAATAHLVVPYRPLRRIWLHAMGHCSWFVCALWATTRNEAVH